jgi:hypothetical protein
MKLTLAGRDVPVVIMIQLMLSSFLLVAGAVFILDSFINCPYQLLLQLLRRLITSGHKLLLQVQLLLSL